MTQASGDPQSENHRGSHADKYNDPRASITRRGVLIGIAIVVVGIVGAAISIYARRTRLEQSTQFWGPETITALQLAERMMLLPRGQETFEPVDLAGTPGLGHLRRRLLDDRSYQWSTVTEGTALIECGEVPDEGVGCIQLQFTDPTAHRFDLVEIDLDLINGWIGPSDGSRRVKTTDWVQPKLWNYFKTIVDVQQLRQDMR